MTESTTVRIPIALIVVDESKNCRRPLTDEDVDTQAAIQRDLMLHPVTVRPRDDGRYDLVAGYRRLAGERKLGHDTIEARIWFGDEIERAFLNLKGNLGRKDLTTWEQATACRRLVVEHGQSPAQIAERTGLVVRTVHNLLRCLRELHPTIARAWETGHPAATFAYLRELAVYPRDQQLARWNEKIGHLPPPAPTARPAPVPSAPTEEGRRRRPRPDQLDRAAAAIGKQTEQSDEWRQGAAATLAFATGRASGLGTYRPRLRRRGPRTARAKGRHVDQDRSARAAAQPVV